MTFLLVLGVLGAALIALFVIPGSTPRINSRLHPNGLAVLEQVPVNDTQQWILIRSENVANPVVLFVHGGPGTSQLTLMRNNTQRLEKYFTVVNWDQRRAGKSFAAGRDDEEMTRVDTPGGVSLESLPSRRGRNLENRAPIRSEAERVVDQADQ